MIKIFPLTEAASYSLAPGALQRPLAFASSALLVCALLALGMRAMAAAPASAEDIPQSDELRSWVETRAAPLSTLSVDMEESSDLRVLDGLITPETRVIALGEGGYHNSHETMVLRNRMFKYLVEHHGVTAILTESMFYSGFAVDDYLARGGELTPELVAAAYCWTDPRLAFEESAALLKWMRRQNRSSAAHRLRFYAGMNDWDAKDAKSAPLSLEYALAYVKRVDAGLERGFSDRLSALFQAMGASGYAHLEEPKRNEMTATIVDLINEFKARHLAWTRMTSAAEYNRALLSAVRVEQLDSWRRRTLRVGGVAPLGGMQLADYILSVLQQEGPNGKLFIFYHNSHSDNAVTSNSFGPRLREVLGNRYVQIGTVHAFDSNDPVDRASMTRRLEMIGEQWTGWNPLGGAERYLIPLRRIAARPLFFLDMRNMPAVRVSTDLLKPDVETDYSTERPQARREDAPVSYSLWRADQSFDAMIFMPSVSPAHAYEAAKDRSAP